VNQCIHTPIVPCNLCNGVTCPEHDDNCTRWECQPSTGSCLPNNKTCTDGNDCTTKSCDPLTGCVFTPISCDDGNKCTLDSCDPFSGCVHTNKTCNDNNDCTTDSCNMANGNCSFIPIQVPPSNKCNGVYCDPTLGIVNVPTQCPVACTSICDPQLGCTSCPSGYGQQAKVATGIGAGVIAAIVIGALVALGLASYGSKKGYDAYMKKRDQMGAVNENPLYKESGSEKMNPLYKTVETP